VSCPHTSQQNGIAERKHRHLVETGLALLAHSSLPLHFWDEAFLTVLSHKSNALSHPRQHHPTVVPPQHTTRLFLLTHVWLCVLAKFAQIQLS
jgi:hypothetical protein